jgi:hypothetical protein
MVAPDALEVPPQRAAQHSHHERAAADLGDGVPAADDQPGAGQPGSAERPRQRGRHRQADEHQRDEQSPYLQALGVHPVGDPRRVGPDQPDHGQQQRGLQRPANGWVAEQVMRQLGDCEDVDQVKKQLRVRDPLADGPVA